MPTVKVEVSADALRPRRTELPPEPQDKRRIWLGLVMCVIVCLPAMLLDLGTADVMPDREAAVLLSSRQTWQRQHQGHPRAWVIPTANGQMELGRPPMSTWLHMLAWTGLDPSAAESQALIHRARLMSVAMGVLAIICTYWAGVSVGGAWVARMAALALGTTLLFVYQARVAIPEAHMMGWVALAIAAGLWAIRPLKPAAFVGRRIVGWLIAGVALGAAVLTKGPIAAMLFILPPLVAAILLTGSRRISNSFGLLFAVLLGVVAATPWYLYVQETVPQAWGRLIGQESAGGDLFLLSASHLRVLLLMSPWQVWLVAALCQPFMRADRPQRRQLLIAWFWFVLVAIAFSIPAARHPRYLAPLLPAAALMIGQIWAYHTRLAAVSQLDPGVNLLRVPHWLMLGVISLFGPLYVALEPWLVDTGRVDQREMMGLAWPAALLLGAALMLIVGIGARMHFQWRPRAAAYATVAWMIAACTVTFFGYSRSYHSRYPQQADAVVVAGFVGAHDLVYLNLDDAPDPAFAFYSGKTIRPITAMQLADLAQQRRPTYVIVRPTEDQSRLMADHGYVPVVDFADVHFPRQLYRTPPPTPGGARAGDS